MNVPFPELSGENLAGENVRLPRDFAGTGPTIVVIAFGVEQRSQIESWIPFIDNRVRAHGERARLVVAIGSGMSFVKTMVRTAMRAAISENAVRRMTVLAFVDLDPFCAALGLPGRDSLVTLVVEPNGTVVHETRGAFTAAAGSVLEGVLAGK